MGSFYMEATQINYRRDETLKTVDQKLQELSEESAVDTDIAPVFSKTATYNPGDLVYYKNKLYVCVTQHNGAWAAADFTASTVSTEISSLKSGLIDYQTQNDLNLEVPDRKNVLPLTLAKIKSLNENVTWVDNVGTIGTNTITISSDSNGYVSAIKVEGSTTQFIELTNELDSSYNGMILTGCPANGTGQTYRLLTSQDGTVTSIDLGDGVTVSGLTTGGSLQIRIGNNALPEGGLTFYPMIRLASETDPTFTPYIPSVNSRLIKHEVITLTGTTTNAGVLSSSISSNERVVMAYMDNYIVMPYTNNGVWKFVICDSSSTSGIVQIKNTEVTISVIKETVGS